MTFTQIQFDALTTALAQGVLTVKYGDKEVTYRSQADMIQLRLLMAEELGIITPQSFTKIASYSKGTNCRKTYP